MKNNRYDTYETHCNLEKADDVEIDVEISCYIGSGDCDDPTEVFCDPPMAIIRENREIDGVMVYRIGERIRLTDEQVEEISDRWARINLK